ncbi:hypothetical protein AMJ40_03385 [candidate division TA06 bacterium DG_26]|uniref:acylphosphatase n=1 Tax=candidate division TA06 bacterium DG_26 TaxID=1703771 RepID=A0A0S7WK41_UNCT6|nr:MAG: hypothetical protein AMJ40_03385 [candidate division TA06 bacterium DG_26]
MTLRRADILVAGLVQGVGYRFFAQRLAKQYGLTGFCRNLPDGTVEVVVEGDYGLVSDYIRELKRGPVSARVSGVEVNWSEYEGKFDDFQIRFAY